MSAPTSKKLGFTGRLLLAQGIVLLTGAGTTWLVATWLGPSQFRQHMMGQNGAGMGMGFGGGPNDQAQSAFNTALLVSMSVALLCSVLIALAVSWYLARRVRSSVHAVVDMSAQIASGRFETRVADPGLGSEFTTLSNSLNALADRLGHVEQTRRHMLADLTHEMRTPVATIEAHLEAVEDGVRDLDDETFGVIRSSTARLRRLAEDIGEVSAAEESRPTLHPRPVEVAEVVDAAVAGAHDAYVAKGVTLEGRPAPSATVVVDAERIGQVLANLLENALRHTESGGRVTVASRLSGPSVEISVTDTGTGIEARHLPHVFDRFYRADESRNRTLGGAGWG